MSSIAELNERLAVADAADDARHIDGRQCTVGTDFAAERPFLLPLPADRFDTSLSLSTRVDRYARVNVRQCYYSVPVIRGSLDCRFYVSKETTPL